MSRLPAPARLALSIALAALPLAFAAARPAAATQFSYVLANHPDGEERPPLYGLRLDDLFDLSPSQDVFTFDFDHPSSSMILTYDDAGTPPVADDTVHIAGHVFGGLDTGTSYGDPLYAGLWAIDFTYRDHVTTTNPQGRDITVTADSANNNGTITPLFGVGGNPDANGVPITLVDMGMGGFSFRFTDQEAFRLDGHPGFENALVGWGWLSHPNAGPDSVNDWLFVGRPVPEPGTLLLVAAGVLGIAGARRRS